jgi:hypothetical protein
VVAEKAKTVNRTTGGIIWYKLTPEALRAVISLSLDKRLKVIKTDKRVAIGMVKTRKEGKR